MNILTYFIPYRKTNGWFFLIHADVEIGPFSSWYEAYETANQTREQTDGQSGNRGETTEDKST